MRKLDDHDNYFLQYHSLLLKAVLLEKKINQSLIKVLDQPLIIYDACLNQ